MRQIFGFMMGIMVGAMVGSTVALLLAPDSGDTLREQLRTHPDRALKAAIWGMLPHNKMGRGLLRRLKIYAGPKHPHALQNPEPLK